MGTYKEFLGNLKKKASSLFSPQDPATKPVKPDYTGRLVMLNVERVRRWQCFNFVIGASRPIQMVPPEADQTVIAQAIKDGILVDVTDSSKDLKVGGTLMDRVQEEDTGKKVYFIQDSSGMRSMVIPKTKEEQDEIERRIAEGAGRIELPPGMDDPDRYMIKLQDK